jgi:hypothetical protein
VEKSIKTLSDGIMFTEAKHCAVLSYGAVKVGRNLQEDSLFSIFDARNAGRSNKSHFSVTCSDQGMSLPNVFTEDETRL